MSEPALFQPMPDGKGHLALDGVSRAELFEHSAYLADAANRLAAQLRELPNSIRPSTLRLEIRELEAQRDNLLNSISGPHEFDDQPLSSKQSYEAELATAELDLRIDTLQRAVDAQASRDELTGVVPTTPVHEEGSRLEPRKMFDVREVRTFGIYARALFKARDGSDAQHRKDAAKIAEEICARYGNAGLDLYNSINQSRITDILDTDYDDLRAATELAERYNAMREQQHMTKLQAVQSDFPQCASTALTPTQLSSAEPDFVRRSPLNPRTVDQSKRM